MKKHILVAALLCMAAGEAKAQKQHVCAPTAIAKAERLLRLHFLDNPDDKSTDVAIDSVVKSLPPIRALKGKGSFDVVEVRGHIYKADYRMRFIFAQIKDACLLMGQEILEASDPY